MTPEELKQLEDAVGDKATKALQQEAANLKSAVEQQIAKMKEEGATKADFESLQEKYDEAHDTLLKQAGELDKLRSISETSEKGDWVGKKLEAALSAKASEIANLKNGGPSVKIELKTAATTVGTGNFGTGVIRGLRMPGIEPIDKNPMFILNLINVIPGGPGSNPFEWLEMQNLNGAVTTVAESGTKPYVDYQWVKGSANAQYIAGVVGITKQALNNLPVIYNLIRTELSEAVMLELQNQILFGDNTGSNLKGIYQYAADFDAGALANTVNVPGEVDVIRAAIAQCYRSYGVATAAMIHPDKAAMMDLQKGTDGHYTMPPFVSADGLVIRGVKVQECFEWATSGVTEGTDGFIVGPMSKSNLNIVEDLTFEVGLVNDMFLKNQLALKAEIYAAHGIKAQHASKFIKGNFTDAMSALAKP